MESIQSFDVGMWNFLQAVRQRHPRLDGIVEFTNLLANPWLLLGLLLLFGVWSVATHRVRAAVFVLAGFGGGLLMVWAIPPLVGRDRPHDVVNVLEEPRTRWSFPCEQTLLATATYLPLGFVLADLWKRRARLILLTAYGLVFLIGVSRMFIGISFPTDILGGWLGGAAWVLFCRWAESRAAGFMPAVRPG
jgi:undecaprenyl-diphosphatase